MIGLVLAAGAGRRLSPLTDDLPKTLLPVQGVRSALELIVSNLTAVEITEIAVVTGFAASRIHVLLPSLAETYGASFRVVHNDRALDWNNAYSLWCAHDLMEQDILLCNGDTVHPDQMERIVLNRGGQNLLLAIDDHKRLAEEEMKVRLDEDRRVVTLSKQVDPQEADGEYVGLSLIPADVGPLLAAALERTFRADPSRYYEDAFQDMASRGTPIDVVSVGGIEWVEVDDHADLAKAREITCRF